MMMSREEQYLKKWEVEPVKVRDDITMTEIENEIKEYEKIQSEK